MNAREGEILLIDKPLEWTSFDVVKRIKSVLRYSRHIKKIKVGHAGTLDPLASGLLLVCTARKTKIIPTLQNLQKQYTGIIRLGATTPSYDLETELENRQAVDHLSRENLESAVRKFVGDINQYPPVFSAKKVEGKRAYEHARQGKEIALKPNQVHIAIFEITKWELPDLYFEVHCSKGTYIRSLAHDLGQEVGVGGHLRALRRTAIGDYKVADALQMDELEGYLKTSKYYDTI
jgi:tRNA pseudouridine55 synthase